MSYELVKQFHEAFGHPINKEVTIEEIELRESLVEEEYLETESEFYDLWDLINAQNTGEDVSPEDIKITKMKLTKELADMLYVIYGTAVSFGLPLDEVFKRVHESNMSKLGDDGKPVRREDGKILKGPNYKPAELGDLF